MHDGLVHIHHAVTALLVVAEVVAAEVEESGIGNQLLRTALAYRQGSQRHEGLEGRARWIGAVEGAIDHRLVGRFVEFLPTLRIDAIDEQVGVVVGYRDQRQNAAGGRFDGNQRTLSVAEGLLGDTLQFNVDGERQVVAGHRRGAGQGTHRTAAGIDFHLFETGVAMQVELIVLLQSGLAEMIRSAIVRVQILLLDLFQIAVGNPANVAQHVRGEGAARILAKQARLDLHAGKTIAMGDELRHFLVRQPRPDRQRLEVAAFLQQLLEALAILGLDVDDRCQPVDDLIQIAGLRRRDFQRVGRVVARQHHAITVEDQAPVGHDGHQGDAVVLGAGLVVVVLHDLQPDETDEQQDKTEQHETTRYGQPLAEAFKFFLGILEFHPGLCQTRRKRKGLYRRGAEAQRQRRELQQQKKRYS